MTYSETALFILAFIAGDHRIDASNTQGRKHRIGSTPSEISKKNPYHSK